MTIETMQDFLNPKAKYYGDFSPEKLIFNDNLQEFSNQIGIIVALETGGKIDSTEAYKRIKTLFKTLKKSKKNLLDE
jgi:hypothetical protein